MVKYSDNYFHAPQNLKLYSHAPPSSYSRAPYLCLNQAHLCAEMI